MSEAKGALLQRVITLSLVILSSLLQHNICSVFASDGITAEVSITGREKEIF